jgi:predicted outer membrane protein
MARVSGWGTGKSKHMKALILPAILAISMAAVGAAGAAISSDDASFVTTSQRMALGAYALASLAQKQAQTPTAKTLAKQVLTNSASATAFLKSYASSHNVQLDNKASLNALNQYGNIASAKGAAFDKAFGNAMHIDAKIAMDTYKDEAAHGSDPALRNFAKKQLAALQDVAAKAKKLAP